MAHTYLLTRVSSNRKLGPIPVVTASRSTCPSNCALRGNGCYAEYGPTSIHWRRTGEHGASLEQLCRELHPLPKGQLWRYAQAGDLPGDGQRIDAQGLEQLVAANRRLRGFTYTHYDPADPHNAAAIRQANAAGFTINLSANNPAEADRLAALGVGPVACIVPPDATKAFKTPDGRHVSICPASVRPDVTCSSCGICAIAQRKAIIGFPAHGTGVKKVIRIAALCSEEPRAGSCYAVRCERAPLSWPAPTKNVPKRPLMSTAASILS